MRRLSDRIPKYDITTSFQSKINKPEQVLLKLTVFNIKMVSKKETPDEFYALKVITYVNHQCDIKTTNPRIKVLFQKGKSECLIFQYLLYIHPKSLGIQVYQR